MLTHHHKLIRLSLISTDLPIWFVVKANATLEQKDTERFSLLLTEPPLSDRPSTQDDPATKSPCLLWFELSPYRVTMTRQAGGGQLNYRHFWERGIYGVSNYWLNSESLQESDRLGLRNFTRNLELVGCPLPQQLRVEYELWSGKVQFGNYILKLEIQS